ncbi:MAG: EI24 domain-containing protein [Pseudomonadota bacterium]
MILSAFATSFAQLSDRRFVWVVLKSIGLTVLALLAVTLGLQWVMPDTIRLPWLGEVNWIGNWLDRAVIFAMIVASIFLMIPISSVVVGLFLEAVADAVEDRHYPDRQAKQPITVFQGAAEGLRFLGLMIFVNLIALVFYVIFTPLAPFIFIVVNGILLGREYAQLVAMRHGGHAGGRAFRKSNRVLIWGTGMLLAVPLLVPILNLVVPVFGVAVFTHLYHQIDQS